MTTVGLTNEELDQVFPTCRVHVYYDTGQRWPENGRTYAILGLQPSFGFYAYHEGQLDGWQTSIQGATRVADNLYVASSPATGKGYLSSSIQAVEPGEARIPEDPIKPVEQPCGCLCQILKLFGLGNYVLKGHSKTNVYAKGGLGVTMFKYGSADMEFAFNLPFGFGLRAPLQRSLLH